LGGPPGARIQRFTELANPCYIMSGKTRSDGSVWLAIGRSCWPIGLLGGLLNIWNMMETSIYVPYVYTRVRCCGHHGELDGKYDIKVPSKINDILREAASFGLRVPLVNNRVPACAIPDFPPHSKMWSGSPGCVNADFVRETSQRLVSINTPLQNVALILLLPVGGTIADACGRRPVLLAYGILCMLSCIIYTFDTKLCHFWGNAMIIIAGMCICPCWEPKDAIMASAVTDLVGERESERNSALSLLWACYQSGSVVGLIAAFCIMRLHLPSYFLPWLVYSCIALCIIVYILRVVPETLPKGQQTSLKFHMFNPLQTQLHALSLMRSNKMLFMLMFVFFCFYVHMVGYITLNHSYLMKRGMSQAEATLPGMLASVVQILCAFSVARFEESVGVMNRFIIANAVWILGYAIIGPLWAYLGHAAAYIAFVCFGIGWATYFPAVQAIVSANVQEEDQAKCQSAVYSVGNIGCIVGPLIWSNCIYDATATGFAENKPVLAALLVAVLCTGLAIFMRTCWGYAEMPKRKCIETSGLLPVNSSSTMAHSSYGSQESSPTPGQKEP